MVDHLQELGLVDGTDDLNEDADASLLATLEKKPALCLPELIQGLAGIGVYALGRNGRGRSSEILARVVQWLEEQALGNAHIFNRIYQANREDLFKCAALAWIRRAMELRRPTPVAGGFWTLTEEATEATNQGGWTAAPGLLEGAGGMALALLAATSAVEPAWDRFMQLDIPCG